MEQIDTMITIKISGMGTSGTGDRYQIPVRLNRIIEESFPYQNAIHYQDSGVRPISCGL